MSHFAFCTALVLALALLTPAVGKTQQLQPGVSVKMVVTDSGPSAPDADNADAWIVTVTGNNDLYFGIDPVTPEGLLDAMKVRPRSREQELYIKADARASFSTVKRILLIAHADMFQKAVLLTEQSSRTRQGAMAPPSGLTVWMSSLPTEEEIVVQIGPGHGSPILKIDNQRVSVQSLQQKLEQLVQIRKMKVVVLKAAQVPFADVAHVVDVCNMAGAKPVLGEPEL